MTTPQKTFRGTKGEIIEIYGNDPRTAIKIYNKVVIDGQKDVTGSIRIDDKEITLVKGRITKISIFKARQLFKKA